MIKKAAEAKWLIQTEFFSTYRRNRVCKLVEHAYIYAVELPHLEMIELRLSFVRNLCPPGPKVCCTYTLLYKIRSDTSLDREYNTRLAPGNRNCRQGMKRPQREPRLRRSCCRKAAAAGTTPAPRSSDPAAAGTPHLVRRSRASKFLQFS